MAQRAVAGVAFVKVDAVMLELRGGLTVSPDDREREGIAGQDGVHGFKETPRVPFIECEVTTSADLSISALQDITNATVTAELANGRTYVLRNAWTAEAREIETEEGKTKIRFEGLSCTELAPIG